MLSSSLQSVSTTRAEKEDTNWAHTTHNVQVLVRKEKNVGVYFVPWWHFQMRKNRMSWKVSLATIMWSFFCHSCFVREICSHAMESERGKEKGFKKST